jgi:hypothetical protein
MDGDSIACARGSVGNFRQRHHHVSALRHRGGSDGGELARIARRVGARAAETVRLLGLSGLFDSVAERAGVAAEANRLLGITEMEWPYARSWSAARVGYGGCDRIYFRIPRGRLYPGLSHHCMSGLDKGLEL